MTSTTTKAPAWRRRIALGLTTTAVTCGVMLGSVSAAEAAKGDDQKVTSTGTAVRNIGYAHAAKSGEACDGREAERYGKNAIGKKVIRFYQTVRWCWNKKKITFVQRRNRVETPGFVWDFKGYQDRYIDKSRQPGRWYRPTATAKFQLCIGGSIGCVQTKLYTIRQVVFRGGGYGVKTSG